MENHLENERLKLEVIRLNKEVESLKFQLSNNSDASSTSNLVPLVIGTLGFVVIALIIAGIGFFKKKGTSKSDPKEMSQNADKGSSGLLTLSAMIHSVITVASSFKGTATSNSNAVGGLAITLLAMTVGQFTLTGLLQWAFKNPEEQPYKICKIGQVVASGCIAAVTTAVEIIQIV